MTYVRLELEHQLISSQEVLLGEQLHVLANVLHVLYGVNLTQAGEEEEEASCHHGGQKVKGRRGARRSATHLLLVLELVGLDLLDLLVDPERTKAQRRKGMKGFCCDLVELLSSHYRFICHLLVLIDYLCFYLNSEY